MNLCLIPARTKSKRIKNKNLKLFCGKPIIEYAICAAKKSKLFDRILISTDSRYLFHNYSEYIPFVRSLENSDDYATLTDVVLEVIGKLKEKYDKICLLLPMSVFCDEKDIIESELLLKNNDSVVSMIKFESNIERAFEIKNSYCKLIKQKFIENRSQDFTPKYYDAGQLYWLNIKSFTKNLKIFMNKTVPYIIENAIDINTEQDWLKAEDLFERTRKVLVR